MMHDVLDLAAVRARHTLLVLRLLWHEDLSRVDLSRRVGLSRSAISSMVAELLDVGLLTEIGLRASNGAGRRATMLQINPTAAYLIGVDLGATHLRVGLLDLRCRLLATHEEPCDVLLGPDSTFAVLARLLDALLRQAGVPLSAVAMIGVGVPGPVDHRTGRVVRPPNMQGWDGEDIAGRVRARYPVPVLVDNDANLGALAEWRFGERRGTPDLIYLKVATGIGAGVLLGGSLHRGSRGGAGEIGHISINEAGPVGRSGNPGSLESYAASQVVLRVMRERLAQGHPSRLRPDAGLHDLIQAAGDDSLAQTLWGEVGRHLGVAITTVLNLFNPEAVVIGGLISQAGAPLLNAVRDVVAQRALLINRDQVTVTLSTLGANVGLLGAGVMLIEDLFTPRFLPHLYAVARASQGMWSSRGPPAPVRSWHEDARPPHGERPLGEHIQGGRS